MLLATGGRLAYWGPPQSAAQWVYDAQVVSLHLPPLTAGGKVSDVSAYLLRSVVEDREAADALCEAWKGSPEGMALEAAAERMPSEEGYV
eukprot:4211997-Pyramimonas_sp.AAC.1